MNNVTFTKRGWEEYLYWQTEDKKTLKKVNNLLKDINRNCFEGIGKPEPLKYYDGFWSRRIDDCNRLVYKCEENQIVIIQCKGHYGDK